jgi:hypothetical protein
MKKSGAEDKDGDMQDYDGGIKIPLEDMKLPVRGR